MRTTPGSLRRFPSHNPPTVDRRQTPGRGRSGNLAHAGLSPCHPSAKEGHTRYRKTVRTPGPGQRLLKSGHNNRKIGAQVVKGKWKGFPIYMLTLEERATCPRDCLHWLDCYGNEMHWSHRFSCGEELEAGLEYELGYLQRRHPRGFLIRLHVLGDFYSAAYVRRWADWLKVFPALHVYGYTARNPVSRIGMAIVDTKARHPERFAMRFSNWPVLVWGANTIRRIARGRQPEGIVCPEQSGDTDCCGTCGLCWTTPANIAFIQH